MSGFNGLIIDLDVPEQPPPEPVVSRPRSSKSFGMDINDMNSTGTLRLYKQMAQGAEKVLSQLEEDEKKRAAGEKAKIEDLRQRKRTVELRLKELEKEKKGLLEGPQKYNTLSHSIISPASFAAAVEEATSKPDAPKKTQSYEKLPHIKKSPREEGEYTERDDSTNLNQSSKTKKSWLRPKLLRAHSDPSMKRSLDLARESDNSNKEDNEHASKRKKSPRKKHAETTGESASEIDRNTGGWLGKASFQRFREGGKSLKNWKTVLMPSEKRKKKQHKEADDQRDQSLQQPKELRDEHEDGSREQKMKKFPTDNHLEERKKQKREEHRHNRVFRSASGLEKVSEVTHEKGELESDSKTSPSSSSTERNSPRKKSPKESANKKKSASKKKKSGKSGKKTAGLSTSEGAAEASAIRKKDKKIRVSEGDKDGNDSDRRSRGKRSSSSEGSTPEDEIRGLPGGKIPATVKEVKEWLEEMGMQSCADVFAQHRVNGAKLVKLDACGVEKMGIEGNEKEKVLLLISALNQGGVGGSLESMKKKGPRK